MFNCDGKHRKRTHTVAHSGAHTGTKLGTLRNCPCRPYEAALEEIQSGIKQSHRLWYIFPQIQGLGHSEKARFYGIRDREEAIAYWNDSVLSDHLVEISRELLKLNSPISWIIGYQDDMKLKSCMTLFWLITEEQLLEDVLFKFYSGKLDERTKEKLS